MIRAGDEIELREKTRVRTHLHRKCLVSVSPRSSADGSKRSTFPNARTIHNNLLYLCNIYIRVNKVGSAGNRIRAIDNARDGIRKIDDTRDRIRMHNVTRGNNGMIIDMGEWIIIRNIIRET